MLCHSSHFVSSHQNKNPLQTSPLKSSIRFRPNEICSSLVRLSKELCCIKDGAVPSNLGCFMRDGNLKVNLKRNSEEATPTLFTKIKP